MLLDQWCKLMFTVLATSTVPGRDVVIEYVRMAMATDDRGPGGSPWGSIHSGSILKNSIDSGNVLKNSTDSALEDSDAVTIAPVGMAAESDVMDQRPAVSSAVGVGNVGVANERGLWNVKSASAASAADIVVTANVGTETYVGDTVQVGLHDSERPGTGVGTVGAGIVF